MDTITIPKKQYQNLLERAFRYDYLAGIVKRKENIFSPPPTRDIDEIAGSFRAANLYSPAFIKSLEKGLKRSDHFNRSAITTYFA